MQVIERLNVCDNVISNTCKMVFMLIGMFSRTQYCVKMFVKQDALYVQVK